jgi:hypothetical protein
MKDSRFTILRWMISLFLTALTLSFLVRLLSTSASLQLPLRHAPEDIVSSATRLRFDPLTNYVKYLIVLGGSFAAFALSFWLAKPVGLLLYRTWHTLALRWKGAQRVCSETLLVVLVIVTLINVTSVTFLNPSVGLTSSLDDTFHEGEYLGFLPAARGNPEPFRSVFLAHGYGKDVLASVLADHLASNNNGIALTRLVNIAFLCLGYLMALAAIRSALRIYHPGHRRWLGLAYIASIGLTAFQNIDVRDIALLVQLAVLTTFLAGGRSAGKWPAFLGAATIGATLPLALLWVYDRALYMMMIVALVSIPVFLLGGRMVFTWSLGVPSGIVLGSAALVALTGWEGIHQMQSQIGYWAKHGTYIAALPAFPDLPAKEMLAAFGIPISVLCFSIAWLWNEYKRKGNLRATLGDNLGIIALLIAASVFQRIAVIRSDRHHLHMAAMPSYLLAVALGAILLRRFLVICSIHVGKLRLRRSLVFFGLLVLAIVLGPRGNANPIRAVRTLQSYATACHTPDDRIVRTDYQRAVAALKKEVEASPCFFTMTSEGVWYYLFDRPSCSRFHQLMYAHGRGAQEELIACLEREKPAIILFSNHFWSNSIDGISVFNAHAMVARYVMEHYEPFRLVGEHWFWHRRESPPRFTTEPVGSADVTSLEGTCKKDVEISGTLNVVPTAPEHAAVYISHGEANQLIWAGRTVVEKDGAWRWTATIPTASLPVGQNKLRFWLMYVPDTMLYPLGHDVQLVVRQP